VQAASRAYFGKDVGDLALNEAAFLAILPKAPEVYGRAKFVDKALARRNWVLDQMVKNGFVPANEAEVAKAQPLGIIAQPKRDTYDPSVGYFVEEVRRDLIDKYGEGADDSPNSVYAGGLWVRTSLDSELQKSAQDALRGGLLRYWSGRVARADRPCRSGPGPLAGPVDRPEQEHFLSGLARWHCAGQVGRQRPDRLYGWFDGGTGWRSVAGPSRRHCGQRACGQWRLWLAHRARRVGRHGRRTARNRSRDGHGGRLRLRSGQLQPRDTGQRQPGSTIKPFVYATALDNGMTPATMVPDQSFCVNQGANLGTKCFKNFGTEGGGGIHTMRWGLEQSRNLMTVHIANDTGMDKVVRTFKRVGIGDYQPYLLRAGRGRDDGGADGQCLFRPCRQWVAARPVADRLHSGPQWQGHLAR
jgi:penicillin-binding protein 1A